MGGLGEVDSSSIFGLVRGTGGFRYGASDFCLSFKNTVHVCLL